MLLVQAKFIVMYALILRFLDLYRKTEKTPQPVGSFFYIHLLLGRCYVTS